jgi:DNA-binding transcriptional LysR family regulator
MDVRSLRYAVTLAEELHFGRAAQRHYISAQPFGRCIQRLEQELGLTLFERTSRRVVLTPAGERVIVQARSILAAVDALPETPHPQRADDGVVTVGVLGFGLAERWPEFVDLLGAGLTGCTFAYRDLDLVDQYDAIRLQHVDAGIIQYTGPVDGLAFEPVLSVPRVAVVPARSPYADADHLTPADVADAPWIPVAAGDPGLATWAGPAAQATRGTAGLRNPAGIPTAVSMTGHLAVHAAAAARFYPHPDVRFVPLAGPACEIAIATRESDNRHATQAIRRAARLLAALPSARGGSTCGVPKVARRH